MLTEVTLYHPINYLLSLACVFYVLVQHVVHYMVCD